MALSSAVADAVDGRVEQVRRAGLRLSEILKKYEFAQWEAWVRRDVGRIVDGDYEGVVSLLTAFGGMGSLSDVLVHPMNGHDIEPGDIDRVNAELAEARGDLYVAATDLKRLLDRT